jgi:hypothetical protein
VGGSTSPVQLKVSHQGPVYNENCIGRIYTNSRDFVKIGRLAKPIEDIAFIVDKMDEM